MQTTLSYRTNRDLFSNYYLDEHLPETEAWEELSDDKLREEKADIMELWEREKETAPKRNESQLEEKFIRPMFRKLGIPFEVEESTNRTQRRPDYGFFQSVEAARDAFDRRDAGDDFYKNAVAVADAKRWGRPLDTRGSGEHERDFENPSYQIHVYLQEVDDAQWAVLTNGKKWRLYYGPTSHRLDSYYEIDLPTVLEKGDLEDFKYFYFFFGHGAFLEDSTGDCFLDDVYDESNVFAQELGEDLQDNIYHAIKILSEGFMEYPDNDLSEDDLDRIHDSSLIYLYRLIFVLYAESEGRDLLDTNNEIYEESYSLNSLKQDIAEELDSSNPKYRSWQDNLWDRLDGLFKLIDQGSKSRSIPEDDLYIPAYNGGLFRTNPDEDDTPEAQFLAEYQVGDAYLAEVIELLTRSQNSNGGGKIFVDYSSLDVRHLGSIYEGLLEYKLNIAEEPLALDDGEYVSADESDDVVVQEGKVYLTTDSGERKATGSYYTPEYVVEYIVENTLEPLVTDIRNNLMARSARGDRGFAAEFAERVFNLKILDPAMGSGHFLTSAIDYLAREIIDAQEKQAAQQGIETVNKDHDINWARRQVAQRCIYGVDLNPLAVELAKVSLWLRTLAAEQPLAFLDHHLKTGNSLVGSNVEEINALERNGAADTEGPNSTLVDFGMTFEGTMENLMAIHGDLIAIENEELEDVKAMEKKYGEFEANVLRQRLEAIVDVYTAEEFDVDVPSGAYEQMAKSVKSDSQWGDIQSKDWFLEAQELAEEKSFFNWRLEYPDIFYDEAGEEKESPGFDVVLGNPPYINAIELNNITTHEKDLWKKQFNSAKDAYDIYILFLEQSLELARTNGVVGLIVPNKHLSAPYAEAYREYIINNHQMWKICDVSQLGVFEDPSVYPVIPFFRTERKFKGVDNIEIDKPVSTVSISTESEHMDVCASSKLTQIGNNLWGPLLLDLEEQDVFWNTVEDTVQLDSEGTVQASSTASEAEEFTVALSEELPSKTNKKFIKTGGIDPFQSFWNSKEVRHQGEYYTKPVLDIDHPVITDLRRSQYNNTKLIFAKVASILEAFVDTDGEYASVDTNLFYDSNLDIRYYGAILNSNVVLFLYSGMFGALKMRGGDFQFQAPQLKQVPVPSISIDTPEPEHDSRVSTALESYEAYLERGASKPEPERDGVAHDFLVEITDRICELKQKRRNLNLALLDYLGIPTTGIPEDLKGESLQDLYMPAPGVADTLLSGTGEDYDGLRIESVSFSSDNSKLVMSVDVSYKPDDEDSRETDRYGRLAENEFETYDVMIFTELSDNKKTLIKIFVPEAVSRAGGFADFRQSATKTITPLERLEDIVLPDLDDIKNGLKKYEDVRQDANELDEKINKTDTLINEVVYGLYDLSIEEINVIEASLEE